ncbi:MAG: hypothetical protein WCG83_00545 [Candidatus Peregrinibacteria bacterium]
MPQACPHCRLSFEILPDDLALLEKLSPMIAGKKEPLPPPTLCPDCRQQRRMAFRNEHHLYRRKCDVTGKDIVSVFSPDSPFKVCEKDYWYGDKFDPFAYGRPYDFSKPFFEQFRNFLLEIPLPSLRVELSENCEFNSDMRECSNCYLCSRTHQSQDMLYTYHGSRSNDCVDCTQVKKSSFLYECVDCVECQDSRFLFSCSHCATSAFLLDCHSCMDCFMCCNLRNKRFCFLNEQLTKEQYEARLKEFNFGSRHMVELAEKMYRDIRKKAVRRALTNAQCENVTGDNLLHCKNCHQCFGTLDSSDGRYLWDVNLYRDSMDAYTGGRNSELLYETTSGAASYDVQFCGRTSNCQQIRYSLFINSSKDIFGSVGLKSASHCILNTQYSEKDYAALLPKIIAQMRSTKEWGEFFPASCALFAYNETAAQEQYPLTEAQAKERGYRWHQDEPRNPKDQIYSVPDTIDQVQDDVTKELLRCTTCGKNYKIVAQELTVYRKRKIPLPVCCPDCRYDARLKAKNPCKLRTGKCTKCGSDMITTYPADTDMQVWCERCIAETAN